ncbi:MAG: Propanediol utilization protein [Oscillospiraceae bacterium]|nr:Propanediol utilization protein [Oscillospiraceae bacterium]
MDKKFIVETSARHLHVTKEDLKILFGEDAELTNKKDLSQPGQFACAERVDVVGPKGTIKNVTILGPERPSTQVEVSATDARCLGVCCEIRESGDICGTPTCKLVGPAGEVELKEGVIVAKRHIHMTSEDAKNLSVSDKEIVWVKIDTPKRRTIYGDVVVRVSESFALAMHIDTDESNAAGCAGEVYGEIVKI